MRDTGDLLNTSELQESKLISDEPQSNSSMKRTLMNYTYIQSFFFKSDVTEHKLVSGSYFPFHGGGGAGVGYSYTEATIFNAS